MKPRSKILLGLLGFLLLLCVQFSDEFTIRDEKNISSKVVKSSKTVKKAIPVKKPKIPAVAEDNRFVLNGKVKISELKPCISKAFCEVNSITDEPTYEANKEFYVILNRLKKLIDDDQKDINSESIEDEEASSEESSGSYEHIPYGPPGRNYPYPPNNPEYRRGKSLKMKNKKKLAKDANAKNINGTIVVGKDSIPRNRTLRIENDEKKEKQEFLARKNRELNVVDDLAALIKISAEIGQALRSPRRCRTLFKKCQMSYEQIINIFNKTQSVETDSKVPSPTKQKLKTTISKMDEKPITKSNNTSINNVSDDLEKEETSGEGNRNKKSRDDFSDEEIEYVTDTEDEPVRTYALFTPTEAQDNRHPEEILVDEAFKKFENSFPKNMEPTKKLNKKSNKAKKDLEEPVQSNSSEEDEESEESISGSRESPPPGYRGDNGYSHRSSEWSDTVPKHKNPSRELQDEVEGDGEADFEEEDIVPEEENKKKKNKEENAKESSEEENEDEGGGGGSEEEMVVHTRDEDNSENGYPHVRPQLEDEEPLESEDRPLKIKRNKGSKRNSKKKKGSRPDPEEPQDDDQNSSEEQEMPPPGSPFYGLLQGMNDGQGADGVPSKVPTKKGKRPSGHGGRPEKEYERPQQDYSGPQQGYGEEGQYPGDPSASQQSFFQSIMSWFSGGNKQEQQGSSSQEQIQPYGGQSSYGGNRKPYGEDLPTYGDYKHSSKGRPSYPPPAPQSYSNSRPYSDEEYSNGPPRRNRPNHGPPQSRGDESSEEVEEEEENENTKKSQRKTSQRQSKNKKNSQNQKQTRTAPPMPVIIVPEGEENRYAPKKSEKVDNKSVKSNNKEQASARNASNKKSQSKSNDDEASDEESRETSSEEITPKSKPSNQKQAKESTRNTKPPINGGVPSYEKYFTNIFGTVKEKVKDQPKKLTKEERENSSLLLNEFDRISTSFSTSADKITDWSEEDNPTKKINVGSLHSNTKNSKGKYTVNKNRNKNKHSSASYEEVAKDVKESSSEEEDDKKKK